MTCSGSPNETWGMTGSMPMIMDFKWGSDFFFEGLKFSGIGPPRPVSPLSENRTNRSNWWFRKISKRFSMNVQWSVFPLSESRTNRSNNNDVWELLRLSCRDCFERLKFFETDIPRSVFSLNGSRANKTNWWFAKISKRF